MVDLSGAFRFRDAETFHRWYKLPAPHAALLGEAVYGLPELYAQEIARARLVANPGCYATSVILALRPLADAGWIATDSSVVCDCKSGATGAGKEPRRDLQFVEVDENFKAYNLFSHRHTPEITRTHRLAGIADHFLHASAAAGARNSFHDLRQARRTANAAERRSAFSQSFMPAGRWCASGPRERLPELQHVAHTNFCDIGFALDASGRRLVIVSCLDNLGKGAAGQAVQNFNHMLGIEEQTGLQ